MGQAIIITIGFQHLVILIFTLLIVQVCIIITMGFQHLVILIIQLLMVQEIIIVTMGFSESQFGKINHNRQRNNGWQPILFLMCSYLVKSFFGRSENLFIFIIHGDWLRELINSSGTFQVICKSEYGTTHDLISCSSLLFSSL